MKLFDFGIDNFSEYIDLVDSRLKAQSPSNIPGISRMLESSGKRLRPRLVIAIAHHSDQEIDDRVINLATAVELVHIASLVHDDVLDNGTLRWGIPTINSKEGLDAAVLAGDYLIAKGCSLAAEVNPAASAVLSSAVAELCVGQAIEISNQYNIERTAESLIEAILGKTSAMFAASCHLGGLAASLDDNQLKTLSVFAENFGITFQYLDDIDNFIGASAKTGKSLGGDIREGNYTLPVIHSLQGKNGTKLKALIQNSEVNSAEILKILEEDDSINFTLNEAESYKQKAINSLDNLGNKQLKLVLKTFVEQF